MTLSGTAVGTTEVSRNPACWSNFSPLLDVAFVAPACTSISEVDPVADEIAVMIREHGFDEKQLRGGAAASRTLRRISIAGSSAQSWITFLST